MIFQTTFLPSDDNDQGDLRRIHDRIGLSFSCAFYRRSRPSASGLDPNAVHGSKYSFINTYYPYRTPVDTNV